MALLFQVYLPCVLQTKKRYVGFMYETPDQKEPVYDAKGIETVRRDSCQAVSKVRTVNPFDPNRKPYLCEQLTATADCVDISTISSKPLLITKKILVHDKTY